MIINGEERDCFNCGDETPCIQRNKGPLPYMLCWIPKVKLENNIKNKKNAQQLMSENLVLEDQK